MNLNKLLAISFLILMISTYQTDSGIIFSLLMKILLLKGALFMTMPLSIGAFMMGQGMGFFAGNMAGGYMMLRAANRYHNNEKVKWTSGGISSGGYEGHHQPHYQHYGWNSNNFHEAFDKGKHIGHALHTFTSHKTKIASAAVAALHKVKGIFVGYKSAKPINKGWGWGKPAGGGYSHGSHYSTHGYNDHDHGHDYHYTSHTKSKPVKSTYKYNPYSHLKSGGGSSYSYKPKGYNSGGYSSSSSSAGAQGYGHYDDTEVEKGHLDYSDYYPPSSSSSVQGAASYSDAAQDPSNTYYTSEYDGPAHEYTGMQIFSHFSAKCNFYYVVKNINFPFHSLRK
jgi:hypothetical protein